MTLTLRNTSSATSSLAVLVFLIFVDSEQSLDDSYEYVEQNSKWKALYATYCVVCIFRSKMRCLSRKSANFLKVEARTKYSCKILIDIL